MLMPSPLQQSQLAIGIQEYPYQKCKFSIVCNADLPVHVAHTYPHNSEYQGGLFVRY